MNIHIPRPVPTSNLSRGERVQPVVSPGGIEAWLFEDHSLPIVSMSFGFAGGAAQDRSGKAGTAKMMASLLDKGAGPFNDTAFVRAVADEAVELSFFLEHPDRVSGQLRTLSRNADRAFALLRLAVCEPRFDFRAVARTRAAMTADVKQALSDPDEIAMRAFRARGFGDHPYGRPVAGDLASLEAIERDDIVALHRRTICRANLRVCVAGAIGADALGRALDTVFADLPEGETFSAPRAALTGLGEQVVTRLQVPQSAICFGRPGLPIDDPDFIAAIVVCHCLGSGEFTSRLMKEVRERRGLCYGIAAGLNTSASASTFMGSTSTPNDRVVETLRAIADEVARLRQDGIGATELETAKSYLIGSFGLSFDTTAEISRMLLRLRFDGRQRSWLDERSQHIAAVTTEQAARATERLFADGAMLVSIAGDPTSAPDLGP